MAILKYNNDSICLGQFDDLIVNIKTGVYKDTNNEVYDVVNGICFKDLAGNTVYKMETYTTFICRLEEKKGIFNLNDVLDDLTLYISKCNIEKYWKDLYITSYLYNETRGRAAVKRFKIEYYNKIQEQIRQEKRLIESIKCKAEIAEIKEEIINTINNINKYEDMKIIFPNWKKENDNFIKIFTKYTLKSFKHYVLVNDANSEGVEVHRNILNWLNEYLNYCINDFDPIEFMEFDKVINKIN